MKIKLNILLFFVVLFSIFSCRKDSTLTEIETTDPEPIVTVLTEVQGLVTDREGTTLSGVSVTLESETATTNEDGFFKISAYANSKRATLQVGFAGYFDGFHTVVPVENDIVRTRIQLTAKGNPSQITSTAGGSVNVNGGGQVSFQPNSFMDEQGNSYNGAVNVYTTYLDPSLPDIKEIMPGNLMAQSADETLQLLKSFGMINVELEGDAGQKIQINQPAILKTPVPASLLNNAPGEIPLWHFDDASGLWVEEGTATLENGIYTGAVSHFSFWNCDVPYNFIDLSGTIRMGNYSPYVNVRITRLSDGDSRTASTSEAGVFNGAVPSGELLLVEVISICGNIVHSEQIGPFSTDENIGIISVDLSADTWTEVSGNVVNCEVAAVTNGYVHYSTSVGSGFMSIQNDGTFSGLVAVCDATEISLEAIDLDESKRGETVALPVSNVINAGTLEACIIEIIAAAILTVDGEEMVFLGCTAEVSSEQGFWVYEFEFSHTQENGTVIYRLTFVDWNGNPEDPMYAYSYNTTLFDSPDTVYDINLDANTLELLLNDNVSGGYLIMNLPEVSATNQNTGETFENCTLSLTGLIN